MSASASSAAIDPRLAALYNDATKLVGIDDAMDELVSMLSPSQGQRDDDDASTEQQQKEDILIDLDEQRYTKYVNVRMLDERQLIDQLRKFLKNKTYFIVIDDIWDIPSWKTIEYALDGDTNLGSRIIITTRNSDVAARVGRSYKLQPLTLESSKILFYRRIFGTEDKCPGQILQVSQKILKKCGGVPLAIITISSLLAIKDNITVWQEVCDSIGSGVENNPDMNAMRKKIM
ncbi:unnamed protein product [Urochloa humidicola]